MKITAFVFLSFLLSMGWTTGLAQDNHAARRYVKQGNKSFQKRDFSEAETSYRKAIEQNKDNSQAHYNLGTALIAQGQDTTAIKSLEQAAKLEKNPLRQSMAYHNLGTVLQGRKMFSEAIEQYKQALRLNPSDDDARYNLVLCKHQLKNQQDNQNQQNQNQNDKQDQQKQDQQKRDQQKQDQQKQQEQKPEMSKDNAEQLLKAAMQQEKQTQQRMKDAQRQPQRRQVEKNW